MKQPKKSVIKYKNGILPNNLSELLENADETELKTLIALLMISDCEGVVDPNIDVPSLINLDKSEFDAAVIEQ